MMIAADELKAASADPAVLAAALAMLTAKRRALIEQALLFRTRHICAVIENVSDSHNTNAVVRSCECFGIQDLHIVSEEQFRTARRILIGSGKWVDLYRYSERAGDNAERCMQHLKRRGYRIAVTVPRPAGGDAVTADALELDRPVAVCFGQERTGISDTLARHADIRLTIPMTGFTESLNISVAAGILLYTLTTRLRAGRAPWALRDDEKDELRLKWVLRCLRKPETVFRRLTEDAAGKRLPLPGAPQETTNQGLSRSGLL